MIVTIVASASYIPMYRFCLAHARSKNKKNTIRISTFGGGFATMSTCTNFGGSPPSTLTVKNEGYAPFGHVS
jgi:hypothetical protein